MKTKHTKVKWERMDFWFSCYVWDDEPNDLVYVITKLHKNGLWRAGKYNWFGNVDYQPHPSRDGYIGSFSTLKSAKNYLEKIAGGE